MSIWTIVLKNIAQRKLSSTLTSASIGLGVAVVIAVLALRSQARAGFDQSTFGYELVVGPKKLSALQLVLNTVYHLDSSPGNMPWSRYQEVAAHKAVLDLVNQAHDQAQNEQLKALIEKAKPVIQKHLDQAEAIQSKLGEATT